MGLLQRAPTEVEPGWATATGPRSDNQDRCAATAGYGVLSDGMGGQAGGDVAADLTVAAAVAALEPATGAADPAVVSAAFDAANHAVRARQRVDAAVADMGATLVLAAATAAEPPGSTWIVANAGDSPAWLVSAGTVRRLTRDHNVAGELLERGALSPEAARRHPTRHVVTRAVGLAGRLDPDVTEVTLGPGDALVLASDGVSDALRDDDLLPLVVDASSATEAAERIVAAALAAGATDNVTTVVLRELPSFGHAGPRSVP